MKPLVPEVVAAAPAGSRRQPVDAAASATKKQAGNQVRTNDRTIEWSMTSDVDQRSSFAGPRDLLLCRLDAIF